MMFYRCRKVSQLWSTIVLTLTLSRMVSFISGQTDDELVQELQDKLMSFEAQVSQMKKDIKSLARQMVLNQLAREESVRSTGTSGIKQKRVTREGPRPYYVDSFTGRSSAAMHDHANNIRTIGLGEIIAVLNGVEFRTRHNDYRLFMPHKTSSKFHAEQEIPFPPVPEAVLNKPTVGEQVAEMREWFKAWRDQDPSERDYTKHFKPVLCYMEGAWTVFHEQVDESFVSDRHLIDAETWEELEELVRFLSYSGGKHTKEDLTFLPKILINVAENGTLIFAQWNYRISCHPLSRSLPLNRFRVVDDLIARVVMGYTLEELSNSRTARFTLNSQDKDKFADSSNYPWLLEDMMHEIPGKDNYPGNLTDDGYNGPAYHPLDKSKKINAAYYHSFYTVKKTDASGNQNRRRGFSDYTVFMALTTQEGIVGMENIKCLQEDYDCVNNSQKWTYAIPLEIIYLTPLLSWNPYNITYKGGFNSKEAKTVQANGRDGSKENPLNGTHSKNYFRTPIEMFEGGDVERDPADTTPTDAIYVLDSEGTTRAVSATGTRTFLSVAGVGRMRLRYPIAPVHQEGSAVWKELDALKQVILFPKTYNFIFNEAFTFNPYGGDGGGEGGANATTVKLLRKLMLETANSRAKKVELHKHTMVISEDQYNEMLDGNHISVDTSYDNAHDHTMVLEFDKNTKLKCKSKILYVKCDGLDYCLDKHRKCMTVVKWTY